MIKLAITLILICFIFFVQNCFPLITVASSTIAHEDMIMTALSEPVWNPGWNGYMKILGTLHI